MIAPKLATANEKDLNTSIMDMPERGLMKKDLSIYDDNRSMLVPTNLRPKDTQILPPTDFNLPHYVTKQSEELEKTKIQVQQKQSNYDMLATSFQEKDRDTAMRLQALNSTLQVALDDLTRERQERLRYVLEVDKLKKENDSLKYQNSRLEKEKNSMNKALGDLKRQRDQAGVQRMQIVAIRNFLLAVELERIRLMYLEKEQECEVAKVGKHYEQANLAHKELQLRAASATNFTQQSTVRIIEKPVIDEKTLISHFLVSLETLRLSREES